MNNKYAFSEYHPIINFLFFAIVLIFTCMNMHPVCLLISFFCSVFYYIQLKGSKATGLLFKGVLPLFMLTVIINPAFSHAGITIIYYLPSGNPLTLESIIYGVFAGIMLVSELLWFACLSEVITSDKIIYLFGKITPAFSLLLSMTLRFIPRFKAQFDTVKEVQGVMGSDTENGKLIKRIKNALTCFSIVVTLSLENAIDTSDSMKSRGYGTGKRTAYSIYTFTERDKIALFLLLFGVFMLFFGGISGNIYWRYYPSIRGAVTEPLTIIIQIVFLAICLMPAIINTKEEIVWKRLRSKI